jgi:hypothetical protein
MEKTKQVCDFCGTAAHKDTRVLLLRESTFGVLLNGTDVVGSDIGVPIILYTKIICSWILLYKGLGRGKRRGVHYYLSYRGPYTVVRRR